MINLINAQRKSAAKNLILRKVKSHVSHSHFFTIFYHLNKACFLLSQKLPKTEVALFSNLMDWVFPILSTLSTKYFFALQLNIKFTYTFNTVEVKSFIARAFYCILGQSCTCWISRADVRTVWWTCAYKSWKNTMSI